MGKLTALAIQRPMKAGLHPDGDGLYLQAGRSGAKSWIYRFTRHGKQHYLGLGSLKAISLKEARELAAEARGLCAKGINPLEHRREQRATSRLAAIRGMTFKQCGDRLIEAHEGTWRNAKHRQQWRNTLLSYAYPIIGALPVQDIDTGLVVKVLQPIWATKPETASRLRGRLENVLDWATVAGYRQGDNPARWRGHLVHLLAKPSKVRQVKHHSALPHREIPAFMADLRGRQSIGARCLEFTILTAARTAETIGATWAEINWTDKVWIVPASRMKARKEHRVPLSPRALEILHGLNQRRESEYMFPGQKNGRPLSNMAMLKTLALLGHDVTVHGFRSAFRDWCGEQTNFPREVAEAALAHAVGDKVEAAYRRGDALEKRRKLMESWAAFCAKPASDAGKVLPLHAAKQV
jgi:integrase